LVGTSEGQARNELDAAGLGINVSYRGVPPGDASDGTVLEQAPSPAQLVDKGTVVDVVVAQATQPATTTSTSTTTTTTTLPPTTTAAPTTTVAPTTTAGVTSVP
jgi:beta-lactam-binding protein with PASTA domain